MNSQTKTSPEPFTESYYKTGNYRDYLTRKFALLAQEVIAPVDVKIDAPVLDFGCGCGGFVSALHDLGFRAAFGTDVSEWAMIEARSRYRSIAFQFRNYRPSILAQKWQLVTMLDVLEHIPDSQIIRLLNLCREGAGYFAFRIPVCANEGELFVLPVSNNDPTHICCHTKQWWHNELTNAGFSLHHTYAGKAIYDSPGVFAAVYK